MTTPFAYHLFHLPTRRHYYGIRYRKGCHPSDLWTKYFSSSKKVHELIEDYGRDSFEFEVRRTFETGKEALEWEEKFLTRIDAAGREDWINESNGGKTFRPPRTHTRKTRKKIAAKITGLERSEETKRKQADAAIVWNAKRKASGWKMPRDSVEKRAEKLRGRKRPASVKSRISAKRKGTKRVYRPDGSFFYSRPVP